MLITVVEQEYAAEKNMARDLEILALANDRHCPVLRLYSWDHPTITLGRLQKVEQVLNLPLLKRDGVTYVHRPTGGRAVLHSGDFTYSLAIPQALESAFGSSVQETYGTIARCLLNALQRLGVDCVLSQRERSGAELRSEAKSPCFLSPTKSELLLNGKKLIGSAQVRQKEGIIQHGSMPLSTAFRELPNYELCSDDVRKKRIMVLHEKATCLYENGFDVSFDEVSLAFIGGFADQLQRKAVAL